MRLSPELAWLVGRLSRDFGLSLPPDGDQPGPSPPPAADPARLTDLAMGHELGPLLFTRHARGPSTTWARSTLPALESAYFQSGRQAVLRQAVLHQVLLLLQNVAEPIVLKGMALASVLYQEAAERTMRDIDLLFRTREEQHRAQELLAAAGYTFTRSHPQHHHLAPVRDPTGRISLELHDNLTTPALPLSFMDALWDRRVRSAQEFWVLDPVGQFLHHAIHALKDPVDSPLLRDVLECACLAARLQPEEQREAALLASLAKADTVVSRTLRMAHNLFGCPNFMTPPRRGPYERWLERRLEWRVPIRRRERWMRHLARERFNRLCEFPDERNPAPWLRKCALGLVRKAAASVPSPRRPSARFYQRPDHASVAIGPNTMVHDAATGEVHMLNETATSVWQAAETPRSRAQLLEVLARRMTPSLSRATLRALVQSGLVREVAP